MTEMTDPKIEEALGAFQALLCDQRWDVRWVERINVIENAYRSSRLEVESSHRQWVDAQEYANKIEGEKALLEVKYTCDMRAAESSLAASRKEVEELREKHDKGIDALSQAVDRFEAAEREAQGLREKLEAFDNLSKRPSWLEWKKKAEAAESKVKELESEERHCIDGRMEAANAKVRELESEIETLRKTQFMHKTSWRERAEMAEVKVRELEYFRRAPRRLEAAVAAYRDWDSGGPGNGDTLKDEMFAVLARTEKK